MPDAAVREIARVLRKYVDRHTLEQIVGELIDTRGDKEFRETIEQLAHDLDVRL